MNELKKWKWKWKKQKKRLIPKYIFQNQKNIDNFLIKQEYKKAFGLLILVLERLNENEKNDFIDYYSKNMQKLGFFTSR